MKKTKDAVKQQLKEQWKKACRDFLDELLRMWELDAHYGYWIADEDGTLYDYGDGMFTINMDNIIYCVLGDITREQYMEWQEYICDAAEFDFPLPNLRSWMRGCPRTPPEAFEKLRKLKQDLNDAVEEEKKKIME
jgi:glutathione S-transferase